MNRLFVPCRIGRPYALGSCEKYDEFTIIGKTRDDAIGEAFDKVARSIGLGYPGGPKIDRLAPEGDATYIDFPKAKVEGYDFSFSGVKSAVLNYLNQCKMKNEEIIPKHIAASFQHAVVEAVVEKTFLAADALKYRKKLLSLEGLQRIRSYVNA